MRGKKTQEGLALRAAIVSRATGETSAAKFQTCFNGLTEVADTPDKIADAVTSARGNDDPLHMKTPPPIWEAAGSNG